MCWWTMMMKMMMKIMVTDKFIQLLSFCLSNGVSSIKVSTTSEFNLM